MKVQQFEIPGLSQYAYVVSSESEAIVIDPMRDFDQYLRYAIENHLTIRYVTETHIHADFASGATPLAVAAGAELLLRGCLRSPASSFWSSIEFRQTRNKCRTVPT